MSTMTADFHGHSFACVVDDKGKEWFRANPVAAAPAPSNTSSDSDSSLGDSN